MLVAGLRPSLGRCGHRDGGRLGNEGKSDLQGLPEKGRNKNAEPSYSNGLGTESTFSSRRESKLLRGAAQCLFTKNRIYNNTQIHSTVPMYDTLILCIFSEYIVYALCNVTIMTRKVCIYILCSGYFIHNKQRNVKTRICTLTKVSS